LEESYTTTVILQKSAERPNTPSPKILCSIAPSIAADVARLGIPQRGKRPPGSPGNAAIILASLPFLIAPAKKELDLDFGGREEHTAGSYCQPVGTSFALKTINRTEELREI
jgi:hypothetical protein